MTSLDAAREAVMKAELDLAVWMAFEAAKRSELVALEGHSGADLLASGVESVERIAGDIARLRIEVDAAGAALAAADPALVDARRDALRAGASMLRARAEDRRAEAAQLDSRIDLILADLVDAAGCEYRPVVSRYDQLSGVSTEVIEPGASIPGRKRAEAAQLDGLATETEQLAADSFNVTNYVRRMARIDPDGPEAAIVAAQAEVDEQARAAFALAEAEADAARDAWIAARGAELAPTHDAPTPEGRQQLGEAQAQAEFANVSRAAPLPDDGSFMSRAERTRWALDRLPSVATAAPE